MKKHLDIASYQFYNQGQGADKAMKKIKAAVAFSEILTEDLRNPRIKEAYDSEDSISDVAIQHTQTCNPSPIASGSNGSYRRPRNSVLVCN